MPLSPPAHGDLPAVGGRHAPEPSAHHGSGAATVTVGRELTLSFETMQLAADSGLTFFAFTAEPGSASEEALRFLATWATTPEEPAASSAGRGG